MGDYICTFEDGSEALIHYGVLGMKWGHRKDPQRYSNAKKWAKRAAIGAGAIGLGAAAHISGADRAVIDYVRNNKKRYLTDFGRTTKGLNAAAKKVGSFGAKTAKSSVSSMGSKVKSNAAKVKTSAPGQSSSRLGSIFGRKSIGPAGKAARDKLGSKPRSIFSGKGKSRVDSVLRGRRKSSLGDFGVDAAGAKKVAESSRKAASDFTKAQAKYAKKKCRWFD